MNFGRVRRVLGPERMTFRSLRGDDATVTLGDGPMKRRRFTAEEIRMIQERYAEEGPVPLALEMGRSENSVSSFAHRCGLHTARWMERQEGSASFPQPVPACDDVESGV